VASTAEAKLHRKKPKAFGAKVHSERETCRDFLQHDGETDPENKQVNDVPDDRWSASAWTASGL